MNITSITSHRTNITFNVITYNVLIKMNWLGKRKIDIFYREILMIEARCGLKLAKTKKKEKDNKIIS